MSKTDSDSNLFAISFGKEMAANETFIENYEDEDNFDAFNDETFGEIDSSNWETEHEKLAAFMSDTHQHNSTASDNEKDFNNKNAFVKTNSNLNSINDNFNESNRLEDDIHSTYDDIVKSISTLGLEDDDFEDPAIMTFSRSSKSMPIPSANFDPNRRLSSCSPPPPAILSYEEFSASPKTQTIWSTKLDTNFTPTISSVNMRTLEDIEQDMLNSNRNSDQLFQLSTIKRPIRAEDLEANFLNQSSNQFSSSSSSGSSNRLANNLAQKLESGWSPFGSHAMHEFIPNGRINQEVVGPIHRGSQKETDSHVLAAKPVDPVDVAVPFTTQAFHNSTQQPKAGSLDPLMKAQTLSEIERQLISNQGSHQLKQVQNAVPIPPLRTSVTPIVQSPPKPFGPQFNQFRPQMMPQMMAQNRVNNMFNRPPVMHYVPGMHPAIGRALFSPALIPNSQRIFPFPLHSRQIMHPLLQHSMQLQQQQQHHHQHNQHFPNRNHNFLRQGNQRYYENNDNEDEYAGLMTQREKEWLIRIQQMQTELKDPYVDDYYNVTYTSRKIAAAAANDKENKTTPSLLLPERPKPAVEPQTNKYIPVQFEGSLGKIQVSNVNCPRKLLDCKLNKTSNNSKSNENLSEVKVANKSEVQKFRKLLLEIEKLYVVLLNIDDEDKRIGALPEEARKSHLETRKQLCDKLFKGLTNESKDKINLEVVQIKKGLALLFRSLSYLSDESQRAVIICDLLNSTNYRQYVIKPKDRLDYGQMLVNAIYNINNQEILLKIVSGINNIALIIKSEYGHRIIESLINQFEKLEVTAENKTKWSIFINFVLDEVDDIPHLRKLCRNHLTKLGL